MAFSLNLIYKIHKPLISVVCGMLFMSASSISTAQQVKTNLYGLAVVKNKQQQNAIVAADSMMRMLDLKKTIPGIELDLKYCGTNNFTHQRLYPANLRTTYLRAPAAYALQKVQASLVEKGLSLKIWDAYRPYSVTEKMWEPIKDERYAANPKFGSGHNRGIAVDLTIISNSSGRELDMGTEFDHFSDTAHSDFNKLPQQILQNRALLRGLMEENGFKVLDTEWWHFYLPESKKFALMDLSFKQLQN